MSLATVHFAPMTVVAHRDKANSFRRSSILFRPHVPPTRDSGGVAGYRPRVRSAYYLRVYVHSPGEPGQAEYRRGTCATQGRGTLFALRDVRRHSPRFCCARTWIKDNGLSGCIVRGRPWAFVGIRSNCMVSNGRDTHESGDDLPLTDAKLCNLKPREKPFKANDGHGLYVLVSTTGAPMAI